MLEKHLLSLITLYGLSFLIGYLVVHKNLLVNYARKILCIVFFLLSSAYLTFFESDASTLHRTIAMFIPMVWVLSYCDIFRKRSKFLQIGFAAFDRPEDRPHTILWLSSNMLVGYWVLYAMIALLGIYDAAHLIFITVFVSALGDGLAEPIGVAYGKHKYAVRALFTKRIYHRTYEGSACVFLSAISAIIAMHPYMTTAQFIAMLLLMPMAMTVTEAKSPHTWDNPFMHLVGGAITLVIVYIGGGFYHV